MMERFLRTAETVLGETADICRTENGAAGYRTTGKALADIHFAISSMRSMNEEQILDKFIKAYYEEKLLAVKWLFYAADVREGPGERRLFLICLNYLAKFHRDVAAALLPLIPVYSRWDHLTGLLSTALADEAEALIRRQLAEDLCNMQEHRPVSLLAKWLPSENASSPETKRRARILADRLGMTAREYRRTLSGLRSCLNIVEVSMSSGAWDKIDYAAVPSRAGLIYRKAFLRHDGARRKAYLEKLKRGEETIHAGVLYPHDIVHRYCDQSKWMRFLKTDVDPALEEMWKALPDYVCGNGTTICVADGSGSMNARVGDTGVSCLDVADAMAIYFSERCEGAFKDRYITFSSRPQFVYLGQASSLREKIEIAGRYNEVANTNIEAVFDLILKTAVAGRMRQEELPRTVLILSDMEFDSCAEYSGGETLFQTIAKRYAACGYSLPRLVFWNICSRTVTVPVKKNESGVALVSGFSPAVVKMVLGSGTDPLKSLLEQIGGRRYDAVEEAVSEVLRAEAASGVQ